MSKMSDLQVSILEDLCAGRLSFAEIAEKHEVPMSWIEVTAHQSDEYDLQMSMEEDLNAGLLSFAEIATKYNMPMSWVEHAADELAAQEAYQYDESMDGDFDSAMASAGHGTDEDYGCYGADDY